MKKRILSGILAVIMVVLAVPLVALPAFAEAEYVEVPTTASTEFKSSVAVAQQVNTPNIITATGTAYKYFEYRGGWTVGTKSATDANDYSQFTRLKGGNTLTYSTLETADVATLGGYNAAASGSVATSIINTPSLNGAVRYVSAYTGKMQIDVTNLNARSAGKSAFAILVNGTPVWPAGCDYADKETWYLVSAENCFTSADTTKLIQITDINVHYGDTVEFVSKVYSAAAAGAQNFGFKQLDAKITFTNITAQGVKSSIAADGLIANNEQAPVFYNAKKTDDSGEYVYADGKAYEEYLKDFGKIYYTSNWENGVISTKNGTYSPMSRALFFVDRTFDAKTHEAVTGGFSWDWKWAVSEEFFNSALAIYCTGGDASKQSPWGQGVGTQSVGDSWPINEIRPTGGTVYSYTYKTDIGGILTVDLPAMEILSRPATIASIKVAVAVNNAVVWPATASMKNLDAWYDLKGTDANTDAALDAALDGFSTYVEAGDSVQFLVCPEYKNWTNSWQDKNGNHTMNAFKWDPAVNIEATSSTEKKYEVIYQSATGIALERITVSAGDALPAFSGYVASRYEINGVEATLPATVTESLTIRPLDDHSRFAVSEMEVTLDDDNIATFSNNWEPVVGTWDDTTVGANAINAESLWTYLETLSLYSRPDGGYVGTDGAAWYQGRGAYFTDGRTGMRSLGTSYGVGLMFTAPSTGTVNFRFDSLTAIVGKLASIDRNLAYDLMILKNGKVIWPSDGNAWHYEGIEVYPGTETASEDMLPELALAEALPTNLFVNAGDELTVIAYGANSCMEVIKMEPYIAYTSVYQAPTTTVSVAVGEKFAITVKVSADGATAGGYYLNDEKVEGTLDAGAYKSVISGIAAKKAVDTYEITPYYMIDELEIKGQSKTVSVATVLEQYAASSDVAIANYAIAALNYATWAQVSFNYKASPTTLANHNLSAAQKTLENVTYSTAGLVNTPLDGQTYTINRAALVLKDEINIKFFVAGKNTGKKLQVSYTADFASFETYDLKNSAEANNSKVLVPVSYMDLDKDLYVRVVDGEGTVLSNTVCYSVMTYVECQANTTKMQLSNLIKSIAALHTAAQALAD